MRMRDLMMMIGGAVFVAQQAQAQAQIGKWYVFQANGIAVVADPANPTPALDNNADAFMDTFRGLNGENPGQLNVTNNQFELALEPSVSPGISQTGLVNDSDTHNSEDEGGQGYHNAQLYDFNFSTSVGNTRTVYIVVRKGDAGGSSDFQSDLYVGADRYNPATYGDREWNQTPYNLAKATAAFRSLQGQENLTCLWVSAEDANGAPQVAVNYEFNAASPPPSRMRTLTVPAKSARFQLIKLTIAQGANSAVIQGFAYSFYNFPDLYVPANWQLFAQTNPATVNGAPGNFVPYFSATKVPSGAGVDNAIYALMIQ